jgi:chemotaxis signal transduction protein
VSTPNASERFLVFAAGEHRYALSADCVRETLSLPRLTALDDTPPWVLGAFDLRGELAPLVSIEVCLGAPTPSATAADLAIVTDMGGHPVALHAHALCGLCRAVRMATPAADADGPEIRRPRWHIALADGTAPVVTESCLRVGAHEILDTRVTPEARLAAFERSLGADGRDLLDERAHRFGELTADHSRKPLWPFLQVLIGGERFAFSASDSVTFSSIRAGSGSRSATSATQSAPASAAAPADTRDRLRCTVQSGQLPPVFDVRPTLGITRHAQWRPRQAVLIDLAGEQHAIAVDAIEHFLHARPRDASLLPASRRARLLHWITGAIQGEDRLLPIVDPVELLNEAEPGNDLAPGH